MGSKTYCLTLTLIKPRDQTEFLHAYSKPAQLKLLLRILQVIFTQSLSTGKLPPDWLTASIFPVFKKGIYSTPSNYRPISLTASCCKIMEHIIFRSIMDHIQHYDILINNLNQHGFRQGYSCQTQLISLIDDISYSLDNHYQTDLILLDFSKAQYSSSQTPPS